MGTHGWRTGSPLKEGLQRDFQGFNLYQLIHLMLRMRRDPGDLPLPERFNRTLRLAADVRHDFAPSEVSELGFTDDEQKPVKIKLANFCIADQTGPLPEPYREMLIARSAGGDSAMADYLNIFNQRIQALRYQAKRRAHLGLVEEGPEQSVLTAYVKHILGLGTSRLSDLSPLSTRELMVFSGLLAHKRKSTPVIQKILSIFFQIPVRIRQFQGGWRKIDETCRSLLGPDGKNHALGKTTVLGSHIWEQHHQIDLTLGPLVFKKLKNLLPGRKDHLKLKALIRYLSDGQWSSRIFLEIRKSDVPFSYLRSRKTQQKRITNGVPRVATYVPNMSLGQTAWLRSRKGGNEKGTDSQSSFTIDTCETLPGET